MAWLSRYHHSCLTRKAEWERPSDLSKGTHMDELSVECRLPGLLSCGLSFVRGYAVFMGWAVQDAIAFDSLQIGEGAEAHWVLQPNYNLKCAGHHARCWGFNNEPHRCDPCPGGSVWHSPVDDRQWAVMLLAQDCPPLWNSRRIEEFGASQR